MKIFEKHLAAEGLSATLNKDRLPSNVPGSELPSTVSLDKHISGSASSLTALTTGSKSFMIAPDYFLVVDPSGAIKLVHAGATTTFTNVVGNHKIQLVKYLGSNKFAIFTSDTDSLTSINNVAYLTYDKALHTISISTELALPSSISAVMEVNTNEFVGNSASGNTLSFRLHPTTPAQPITFKDISTNPNNHNLATQVVYQDSNLILLKEGTGNDLFIGRFDSKTETYISTGKTIGSLDGAIIPVRGTTKLFIVEDGKLTLIDTKGGVGKDTPTIISSLTNVIFTKDISPQDIIKFNNNQYGFVIGGKLYEVDVYATAMTSSSITLPTTITGHVSIQTGEHEYLIGDTLQKVSIDRGNFGEFHARIITRVNGDTGGTGYSRGYITLSVTFHTPSGTGKTITKVIDGFDQKVEADQGALVAGYVFTGNTKNIVIKKTAAFTVPANLNVQFAVIDPQGNVIVD